MEKVIIFGAGKRGQRTAKYLMDGLDFIGFYDSDKNLWGTEIEGNKVLSKEDVKQIITENDAVSFLISPKNTTLVNEIREIISNEFRKAKAMDMDEFQTSYIERKHLNHMNGESNWHISFEDGLKKWVNGILDEIEYTRKAVMEKTGRYHEILLERLKNDFVGSAKGEQGENIYNYLNEGSVLIEIGTSQCSSYGTILPNGKVIKTIGLDGLADFYNRLNQEYVPDLCRKEKEVTFGTFEFMSVIYEKDFADVILIENALDHGIDPLKGILECLHVIKIGGVVRLCHRRCEAIFEIFYGQHQWNIDYNKNLEFVIWSRDNYINVNQYFGDDVEIKVIPTYHKERIKQFVTVELTKKPSFDIRNYITLEEEIKQLSKFNSILIDKMAEYMLA